MFLPRLPDQWASPEADGCRAQGGPGGGTTRGEQGATVRPACRGWVSVSVGAAQLGPLSGSLALSHPQLPGWDHPPGHERDSIGGAWLGRLGMQPSHNPLFMVSCATWRGNHGLMYQSWLSLWLASLSDPALPGDHFSMGPRRDPVGVGPPTACTHDLLPTAPGPPLAPPGPQGLQRIQELKPV